MNILPEKLEEQGYELIDSLNHKDLIPFIIECEKKKTLFTYLFWISSLLPFFAVVPYILILVKNQEISTGSLISYGAYGIALTLVLIPFHELIHALAYRYVGAKNTSYDMNLKKFYFMAMADKFVANRSEFLIVGMAPFIVISLLLILFILLAGPLWKLTLLLTLAIHTGCCRGDFALLGYFQYYKDFDVVTYDDKEIGMSYFYKKLGEN